MVPPSTLASAVMLFSGVITFTIMLLPTLIMLKKPKDANPRILENEQHRIVPLVNIELEIDVKFDRGIVRRVAEIIAILPNLEP